MRAPLLAPSRRDLLQATAAAGGLLLLPSGRLAHAAESAPPAPVELRYRQVHLDFHTSGQVAAVGAAFDPEAFADTLARARVNSVTCFARCHHGYVYYDSKAHPQRKHPHLTRNLLKEQIDACHKKDIRVPIYVTVQWDQLTADEHPEWRQMLPDGRLEGRGPYEPGFYRRLCLNSPYVDFLKAHLDDVFASVPVDGFFLDIVAAQDCSCTTCRREMARRNVDASDEKARRAFGSMVVTRFRQDLSAHIRRHDRRATIFYNGGHVGPDIRSALPSYSHLELESLPSGGWGYLHFPLTARYARTLGIDTMGMTGKFHTSWGDFHSLKNRAALEFECFSMLALGAKCSIGDQLHPSGRLDPATYDLIGHVFGEVERKEPYCQGARPLVDLAVLSPEEFAAPGGRTPASARGVVRMLQEGAHQFDVVDSASDLGRYRVLVLPDEVTVGPKLRPRLEAFVARGGALLATHRAAAGDAPFAARVLGLRVKGDAPYAPDYLRPRAKLARELPNTELNMYGRGLELTPQGAEVLADVVVPYFNRTWQHYFSHRNTPSSGTIGYPGVLQKGRAITFAHPVFTQYAANAPRWCKRLVLNALDLLLPDPLVRHEGPSTLLTALHEQPQHRRYVLHLLHYVPERRGDEFDVIEDVLPVHDLRLSVRAPKAPTAVHLVPASSPLPFTYEAGRVRFVVPKLVGHQLVTLSFA
jgi:hypothetical protein